LINKVSVVDNGQTIELTGVLTNQQRGKLTHLIDQLETDNSGVNIIYQNIPYAGSLYPTYLPSPIASFGGNIDSPYLILVSGMRCSVGTKLPSGYTITDIGMGSVTLKKDGKIAHFPIAM